MYLVAVVSEFYKKIDQKYLLPIEDIKEIYTFNYTPTLENIYGIDNNNVTYLHGKINEKEEIQNIILGISDLNETLEFYKMYNFSKSYQKVKKGTNYKFIHNPENESGIEQKLFYLIGHSLDISDKEYVKDLFKHLNSEPIKNSEIIIFYYNQKDYDNKLKNLFSIMGKVVIVEANKANRLRFVEINKNNVSFEFKREIILNNI